MKLHRYRHFLFIVTLILLGQTVSAQNEAYESDVIKKGNTVYYEGKPFTGWLLSDANGVPNKCDCTLKAQYKNGKLHGTKKLWYKNGTLKFSGQYYKGYNVGTHISYFRNGNPKEKNVFQKGGIIHKIIYRENGKRKKYEKYVKGELVFSKRCTSDMVGDCIRLFSDETVTEPDKDSIDESENENEVEATPTTLIMVNDSLDIDPPKLADGVQKILYPNGSPRRIIYYQDGLITLDSLFYKNRIPELVKIHENGELIHREKFDEDGIKLEVNNFKNLKKDGIQTYFYDNGNPKEKEFFEQDVLVKRESYYDNGKLESVENYIEGNIKHGKQKKYDEDGNLKFVDEYDNGKLQSSTEYKSDHPVKTIFYNSEGKKIKENQYDDSGKIKKEIVYSLITGYPERSIEYTKDGEIHLTYDDIGNVKDEKAYLKINDKLKLIREGSYVNGKKNGKWIYYDKNGKSETLKIFKFDKIEKERTIYYDRLIKNRIGGENTDIVVYKTRVVGSKPKYYLLKYTFSSFNNKDTDVEKGIVKKINSFFKDDIAITKNYDKIKDSMLDGEIRFNNIRYRLSPKTKKENNNKFKLQFEMLASYFEYKKDSTDNPNVKNYLYPKSLNDVGYAKKQKAIENTMELVDISNFLIPQCFPKKANILHETKSTDKKVSYVTASMGKDYVHYKDLFFLKIYKGKMLKTKAKFKVEKTFDGQSLLKVLEGGEWLKKYMKTHKYPVITNKGSL